MFLLAYPFYIPNSCVICVHAHCPYIYRVQASLSLRSHTPGQLKISPPNSFNIMASSSSPGLKDLLSPTPASENFPITKTLKGLVSSSTSSPSHSDLAREFEKLSVESNVKLSPQGSSSSPPSWPSLSDYVFPTMEIAETTEENLCKRKVEYVNPDGNEFYLKRNLEKKLLSGKSVFLHQFHAWEKLRLGNHLSILLMIRRARAIFMMRKSKFPMEVFFML